MAKVVTEIVKYVCDWCGSEHDKYVEGHTRISDITLNYMLYGDCGLQARVEVDMYHPYGGGQCLCRPCTIKVLENTLEGLKSKK